MRFHEWSFLEFWAVWPKAQLQQKKTRYESSEALGPEKKCRVKQDLLHVICLLWFVQHEVTERHLNSWIRSSRDCNEIDCCEARNPRRGPFCTQQWDVAQLHMSHPLHQKEGLLKIMWSIGPPEEEYQIPAKGVQHNHCYNRPSPGRWDKTYVEENWEQTNVLRFRGSRQRSWDQHTQHWWESTKSTKDERLKERK